MSYAGKYALAKHETLALKCEALESKLEEARYSATDYAMKLGRANEELAEATNKLNKIESVCNGYKSMQTECETDTEIPYWDIMNIIKGTTTEDFGYLKEKGDE